MKKEIYSNTIGLIAICCVLAGRPVCAQNMKEYTGNSLIFTKPQFQCFAGYGLFGFYEVKNTAIYDKINATGSYFGGAGVQFDPRFAAGIIGGYNSLKPQVKGTTGKTPYYMNSVYGMVKVWDNLVIRRKYNFYIAGAIGLKSVNKNLPDEKGVSKSYTWEIIIAGLNYRFTKNFSIFGEAGLSDIGFVKLGICY